MNAMTPCEIQSIGIKDRSRYRDVCVSFFLSPSVGEATGVFDMCDLNPGPTGEESPTDIRAFFLTRGIKY